MRNLYKNLPETPGVYLMKDAKGELLYVGKAGNLRRRVQSYFTRPHDIRIEKLVERIAKIEYEKTETAIEALILEAKLIKEHAPLFNVREKDDKSFLYVEFTKEKFPRVLLVRGRSEKGGKRFGPFTSASSIRQALKLLRKIFPFATHPTPQRSGRPCFDYQIGLCPGTCVGKADHGEYLKNIRNLMLFFEGKKKKIIRLLQKEMEESSANLAFEKAEKIKRQLFALRHIQDVALIGESSPLAESSRNVRIEGYDISNISGTSAVGSMVVFRGSQPDKNEYRKFKIRTISQANDVGMLEEILRRRFSRTLGAHDWPLPDLILVDGGKGQVHAARRVLDEYALRIPIVGIAKGPERKRNDVVGALPDFVSVKILIAVRDEAHRFAISYHKKLRGADFRLKK